MVRRHGVIGTGIALVLLTGACAQGSSSNSSDVATGQTYLIRAVSPLPATDPLSLALAKFGKDIEAASNGKIKVQVFPQGTLGTTQNQINQLKAGAVQMGAESFTNFIPDDGDLEAMNLPFIFPGDVDKWHALMDGSVGAKLKSSEGPRLGIKVLEIESLGQIYYESSVGPINSINDFKGRKIRITNSKVLSESYTILGAQPVSNVDLSEAFTVFSQKIIDTAVISLSVFEGSKFYEFVKYITKATPIEVPIWFGFNLQYWQSLPARIQQMISQVVTKVTHEFLRPLQAADDTNLLTLLATQGVKITTPDSSLDSDVRAKLQPEYTKIVSSVRPDTKEWLTGLINAK